MPFPAPLLPAVDLGLLSFETDPNKSDQGAKPKANFSVYMARTSDLIFLLLTHVGDVKSKRIYWERIFGECYGVQSDGLPLLPSLECLMGIPVS